MGWGGGGWWWWWLTILFGAFGGRCSRFGDGAFCALWRWTLCLCVCLKMFGKGGNVDGEGMLVKFNVVYMVDEGMDELMGRLELPS